MKKLLKFELLNGRVPCNVDRCFSHNKNGWYVGYGDTGNVIRDSDFIAFTVGCTIGKTVDDTYSVLTDAEKTTLAEELIAGIPDLQDEQDFLDNMTVLSKLKLCRALNELDLWKPVVKPLIKGNEDFEDAWNNATVIDLADPTFCGALALTNINLDDVKRKILELRSQ